MSIATLLAGMHASGVLSAFTIDAVQHAGGVRT
jgi:hypothetical protein